MDSWVTLAGQGKVVGMASAVVAAEAAVALRDPGWEWVAEPGQVAAHGSLGGGLSFNRGRASS